MNGGKNEAADDIHGMTQALSQQQQQQVNDDITAVSFSQHLGQLPGSGVDQLTVKFLVYLVNK